LWLLPSRRCGSLALLVSLAFSSRLFFFISLVLVWPFGLREAQGKKEGGNRDGGRAPLVCRCACLSDRVPLCLGLSSSQPETAEKNSRLPFHLDSFVTRLRHSERVIE
jgi:hypothetical protein